MKRVRTPTRIQMEAAECGAVALAIVLEYHGHYADIETLRERMGVSRDGTSAGQIARTAREYGLEAQGAKAELDDLAKVRLPAVLHWEFNHFVVLEGTRGSDWFINDPAVGPRRLSRAEMDAAFTGIVLLMAPGAHFERTPPAPSIARLATHRFDGVRAALWVGLVASLGMVLPNMLVPTFSGIFTDRIVIQSHTEWLWALLAAMLVFGLTRAWTVWLRGQQLARAQTAVSTTGALGFLRHALRLPVSFYYHRFAAEIANRLNLNESVANTLVQTVAGALIGAVCMLIYGVIMAHYDLELTLLALLFAGISMGSLALSQRLLADSHRRVLVEEARRDGLVNRSLAGYEESSAAGTNDLVFDRVIGQHSLVVTQRQAVLRNAALLQALQRLLATLGLVAVLVKGGYDIMDGVITVGMMVAFQGLMYLFGAPIAQLLGAGVALQDVRGNLERIEDVTTHPVDAVFKVPADQSPPDRTPVKGRVEFRGVRFGYAPDRPPQLQDLDLVIEAGSSVAIVGASGCGKSTLARLLVGQLTPQAGDILLDEKSVLSMPRERRFAALAHVDQEVRLFTGSVMDNLTLWNAGLDPGAVREAARDAAIDDMIAQRPGGYGARVVEAGANMSGGERQRLDIARALSRGAPLLVLDEATSALDPQVERVVLKNVLARGLTLVFISHRLAPLDLFDRIVVMQAGAIVQDGRFDELIGVDGPLRQLVDV